MTPYEFIDKWRAAKLKERSASQEHFIDLCRLLRQPTPARTDRPRASAASPGACKQRRAGTQGSGHRAIRRGGARLPASVPGGRLGQRQGIETNPYPAEVVRASAWSGEIQCTRRTGVSELRDRS